MPNNRSGDVRNSFPGLSDIEDKFNLSIADLLKSEPGGGSISQKLVLADGTTVTDSFFWASAMHWLFRKAEYQKAFGVLPPWVAHCHLVHRSELCGLALKAGRALPDTRPITSQYELNRYRHDLQVAAVAKAKQLALYIQAHPYSKAARDARSNERLRELAAKLRIEVSSAFEKEISKAEQRGRNDG